MRSSEYMTALMKTVKNREMKMGIKEELQDCIDDLIESYMENGMTREDAEAEAVKQMGSPEETGELFNQVYRPKFEWKSSWYMLLWIAIVVGIRCIWAWSDAWYEGISMWEVYQRQCIMPTLSGIVLLIPAIWLSYEEKANDLPFLWIKKSPSKHWAMKGLGVFGNSASASGVAIALMAKNLTQGILLYGFVTVVMLLQRLYVVKELVKNEQKYIYKECVALKDFNFKGPVYIGNEKHKVQLAKGTTAKKGDYLTVVRTDGFTLIVDKM